jgi:hypothetical protein
MERDKNECCNQRRGCWKWNTRERGVDLFITASTVPIEGNQGYQGRKGREIGITVKISYGSLMLKTKILLLKILDLLNLFFHCKFCMFWSTTSS